MNDVSAKKPRVLGIVALLILRGVVTGISAISLLGLDDSLSALGSSTQLYAYLLIAMAVVLVLGGILTGMYKRLGLFLGGAVTAVDLILSVILLIGSQVTPNIIGALISLAILYYIYKYLTSEPEKSFFT